MKRFADKDSHQVFLEPEGLHVNEWYPNGISTSLPFDVQLDIVHNMPGLEHAHLLRPGYAIEYDFYDPRGLKTSMETKAVRTTARRVTKRPPHRGFSPVSMPRSTRAAKAPGRPAAIRPISA